MGWVEVARGSLYLAAADYRRWFGEVQTVAAVPEGSVLWLLPVRHASAGGLIAKIRNARGDRVIHAPELLAACGLDSGGQRRCAAQWDEGRMALRVELGS